MQPPSVNHPKFFELSITSVSRYGVHQESACLWTRKTPKSDGAASDGVTMPLRPGDGAASDAAWASDSLEHYGRSPGLFLKG